MFCSLNLNVVSVACKLTRVSYNVSPWWRGAVHDSLKSLVILFITVIPMQGVDGVVVGGIVVVVEIGIKYSQTCLM